LGDQKHGKYFFHFYNNGGAMHQLLLARGSLALKHLRFMAWPLFDVIFVYNGLSA
jgi:hypothetical protein